MSSIKKAKPWPTLPTDQAAADFVENADLSEFDWSQAVPITMEHRKKDGQLNVRMPDEELSKVREAAKNEGIPLSRFVRLMITRGMQTLHPR
jgi:predicted DNA binding CopG/RHH family protein